MACYRGCMADDSKLLCPESEECQYLMKAVEYCRSQSTNGDTKYSLLDTIVKGEIQQVRHCSAFLAETLFLLFLLNYLTYYLTI